MAALGPQVMWVTIVNVALAAVTALCLGAVAWALLADILRRDGTEPEDGSRERSPRGRVLLFPRCGTAGRDASRAGALGRPFPGNAR
jgi:hypothetical protein